jgi:hypothetical protein
MQWWNNFVDWLTSDDGWRVLSTIVFPFLAIIVAGFIAAMIGRGATRRLITLRDREQRVSTVAALIGAARRASKYNTLSGPEREHADHLAHDADVSTRLLPLSGASMTADWAAHEIEEMKKNSVSFSFQAEQSLMDFRDRLVEWQARPSRAKKLFKADLDLWAYESSQEDKGLVEKQQEWAKQQVATETDSVSTAAPQSTSAPQGIAAPQNVAAPESKPISWGATATAPSTNETPAVVSSASPVTAATATGETSAIERPTYGMRAESPAAAPTHDDSATDTGEQAETHVPSPVSAQTVRQRVLPENYESDDLR